MDCTESHVIARAVVVVGEWKEACRLGIVGKLIASASEICVNGKQRQTGAQGPDEQGEPDGSEYGRETHFLSGLTHYCGLRGYLPLERVRVMIIHCSDDKCTSGRFYQREISR
jgi:hypothetical protein